MPKAVKEKILKIKEEKIEPPQEFAFQPEVESDYQKGLFPRDTIGGNYPTLVGKSIKMRDLFNVSGCVNVNVTSRTLDTSTTQTNLKVFVFSPDEHHIPMVLRLTATGVYSTANATDTITLRVGNSTSIANDTEGASTSVSFSAINTIVSTAATVTNQPWNLTWYGIIQTLGSSGKIEGQLTGHINNVQKDNGNTSTANFDTTVNQVLVLTAQWSNALAGNTITIRQFILEVLN